MRRRGVIDGYAVLGAHLLSALNGAISVIGVAKTRFADTRVWSEILRGGSGRPLYVTSVGIDEKTARLCIRSMHGPNRIPTLLAATGRACRTAP